MEPWFPILPTEPIQSDRRWNNPKVDATLIIHFAPTESVQADWAKPIGRQPYWNGLNCQVGGEIAFVWGQRMADHQWDALGTFFDVELVMAALLRWIAIDHKSKGKRAEFVQEFTRAKQSKENGNEVNSADV